MTSFLKAPATTLYEEPKSQDVRLKHIIANWHDNKDADLKAIQIGIIGVPYDEAIAAGGGRPGAKDGPDAIRKALKRFGTTYYLDYDLDISNLQIMDFGDIDVVSGDTIETHNRITQGVQLLLTNDILPIVLGGGHDMSFATVRAMTEYFDKPIGGINIDAHLDVREVVDGVISSGTPYRRALEELNGKFDGNKFSEIGMHHNVNSKAHCDYLRNKGAELIPLNTMRGREIPTVMKEALKKGGENQFFSIDIDVMGQAYAPGCSAPSPIGIIPEEISEIAFLAGKEKSVKLFDLAEVSPSYDEDGRTARLAAAIISDFLAGYALR